MALIARVKAELSNDAKFLWLLRGTYKDGSPRFGKVRPMEEFTFHGTRAELDACPHLEYVEGEDDAPASPAPCPVAAVPEAAATAKRRGRPRKARSPVPAESLQG